MSGVDGPAHNGTSRYSSSPELSSPPCSPSDPGSPAARQLLRDQRDAQDSAIVGSAGGVVDERASLPSAPPARKKPGRKPKIPVAADGASATSTDTKPKRGRKPREPKDPNAAPVPRKKRVTASTTTTTQDADVAENNTTIAKPAHAATRQSKLTDMSVRPAGEPGYSILNEPFQPQPQHQYNAAAAAAVPQNGKFEDIQKSTPVSFFNAAPPQPQPQSQPQPPQQSQQPQQSQPVRSSGQNYDPIRSNYDPVRENMSSHNPYHTQMSPKPAPSNRASASPSIASLVDPPHQSSTSPSMAAQSFFQHQMKMHTSVPPSPTSNRVVPSPTINPSTGPSPSSGIQSATRSRQEEAKPYVRAPAPPPSFTANPAQITSISKPPPSTAPSKPSKPIDATPPPLPGQGSGFFNAPKDGTESRAPTIVLHIPLNGGSNKYINFTRLAEERYGWDALHPRLAAQRERLARVAAAGAALEKSGHKESGDEMSLDMSDAEGDNSNVEMGGVSDGRTGTDAGGAKKVVKKRRMKEDDYDKDDGFVDDSDLLWEEQAAASVDGFFVYSGPLVPEGEKPTLERGEGSKRARGSRGRGGARVASGTRGGHAAAGAGAAGKEGGKEGGPGSRGGGATRKPRITKADRARRDAEKVERERMG
ncbi:hypothetical protein V500_05653, partial [Pseudogymnoascus sp. VKM F-4518 (FW-2643)]